MLSTRNGPSILIYGPGESNVAVTDWGLSIVTRHVVAVGVLSHPVNPANTEPMLGIASSVTSVFGA